MREIIIYKITNTVNEKVYVGQTAQPLIKRFQRHCWKSELRKNMVITQAIHKYGKENFSIEEIERVETLDDANSREVYWAKYYNCFSPNGYNLKAGGRKFAFLSDETKRKISIANKGKRASKETIKRLSESHKGIKLTDVAKRKLSEHFKGKPIHKNTLDAIKQKCYKRYILEDINGVRHEFVNMAKFCKDNNLQKTNMSKLVNNKIKSYKGWTLVKNMGYESKRIGSRRNPKK